MILDSPFYLKHVFSRAAKTTALCKSKNNVDVSIPSNQPKSLSARDPARHATGERPLQSETSLKNLLRTLEAACCPSITSFLREWAATAAFGLGGVRGVLMELGVARRGISESLHR